MGSEFSATATNIIKALDASRRMQVKQRACRYVRRTVCRNIHIKQFEETEHKFISSLIPLFSSQIQSAKQELGSLEQRQSFPSIKQADSASALVQQIFRPSEWLDELINLMLPMVAQVMTEAAVSELFSVGIDIRKHVSLTTKQFNQTPAMWLTEPEQELPPWISTDLPQWMKDAIEIRLRESFAQDYWQRISETTADDIESFLREGLQEGQSIREMASNISSRFPEEYSMRRATLVARTESGDSLNSGRKLSIDKLQEELGPQVDIGTEWLSVLSNNTRDAHAALDGVMADENGLFSLNGILVPWPGHFSLPIADRANCFPATTLVEGEFIGAQRAWYEGVFSEIITRKGWRLTLTPNHPVMTSKGFVAAGVIKPGDQVITYASKTDSATMMASSCDQVENEPVTIKQVFEAHLALGATTRTIEFRRASVNDFYGDGESIQGDIQIVWADWELLQNGILDRFKEESNPVLVLESMQLFGKSSFSAGSLGFSCVSTSSPSNPSSGQDLADIFRRFEISPAGALSIGIGSNFDPGFLQSARKHWPAIARFPGESIQRDAGTVSLDDIVKVRNFYSAGHVYDLQSTKGVIIARDPYSNTSCGGIVTSNCQCSIITAFGVDDDEAMRIIEGSTERIAA